MLYRGDEMGSNEQSEELLIWSFAGVPDCRLVEAACYHQSHDELTGL